MNYQRYLASREWRVRRNGVMERAKGICERCWGTKATQVHHVTYERVGNELPEDLLALCGPCHEFLSAVTDHDPVAAIPTLAHTDDGFMGSELSRLAELDIAATGRIEAGDTDEFSAAAKEMIGWVVEHVRFWVVEGSKRFPSMPENEYGIVHAVGLLNSMQSDDAEIASAVMPVIHEIGLSAGDDPWRRWRVPLKWLHESAA